MEAEGRGIKCSARGPLNRPPFEIETSYSREERSVRGDYVKDRGKIDSPSLTPPPSQLQNSHFVNLGPYKPNLHLNAFDRQSLTRRGL